MKIAFACPHCAAPYQVDSAHAGRKFACKKCTQVVTVPAAAPPTTTSPPKGTVERAPAPAPKRPLQSFNDAPSSPPTAKPAPRPTPSPSPAPPRPKSPPPPDDDLAPLGSYALEDVLDDDAPALPSRPLAGTRGGPRPWTPPGGATSQSLTIPKPWAYVIAGGVALVVFTIAMAFTSRSNQGAIARARADRLMTEGLDALEAITSELRAVRDASTAATAAQRAEPHIAKLAEVNTATPSLTALTDADRSYLDIQYSARQADLLSALASEIARIRQLPDAGAPLRPLITAARAAAP